MTEHFDLIVKASKRHNIFFKSICLFKTVKNNIMNIPWFDITMEHDYQEVSVDKETAQELFRKGIVIGDGDLICTRCGTISHDMIEHSTVKGHFYCRSNNCAHYQTNIFTQIALEIERVSDEILKHFK